MPVSVVRVLSQEELAARRAVWEAKPERARCDDDPEIRFIVSLEAAWETIDRLNKRGAP